MGLFRETNGYNTMGLVTMVKLAKNMGLYNGFFEPFFKIFTMSKLLHHDGTGKNGKIGQKHMFDNY